MNVTIELWQFVGGLVSLMTVIVGAVAWMVSRVVGVERDHASHEKICAERYARIADNHDALAKAVDTIADTLVRVDEKVDRLVERS